MYKRQGGILNALASTTASVDKTPRLVPTFTAWTTRVSNPVCSPRFRSSASVPAQGTAFANGVPPDICAFHRYTGNSIPLYRTLAMTVSAGVPGLSPGFSRPTCQAAYEPFTPNKSGQRSPPTYYRGCWHVVSRGFFSRYRQFLPSCKGFTTLRPSSPTRRRCVRLSPIAQDSLLLPPVGVWTVSQFQCG